MTNEEQIRKAMGEVGYDKWYFADLAFAVSEGNDYDDACQSATDEIVGRLGIIRPTEYGLVNDIVNKLVSANL